jgi:hypothetical protein
MVKNLIPLIVQNLSKIGLAFNFIGTVVLVLSLIKSNKQIDKESGTYWDNNPYTKLSITRDRRLAIIGLSLIAIGFLLQIFSFSEIVFPIEISFNSNIILELATSPIFITLLSIFFTFFFGVKLYRKQKERDEIHKKYVEGLENLGKNIAKGLAIIRVNFATAIDTLKYFNKLKPSSEFYKNLPQHFKRKIIVADEVSPEYNIFYMEKILPNKNKKLMACYIASLAKIKIINTFFETEFIATIDEFIKQNNYEDGIKEELFKKLLERSKQKVNEASEIYGLASIVSSIVFRIRKMKISKYGNISKIEKDREINKILEDDLEKWAQKANINLEKL